MSMFGHSGRLDFTAISQPWLRESTKRWAIHDLIHRRGEGVTTVLRTHVAALARLSESLRAQRSDRGLIIHDLGRPDIELFFAAARLPGALREDHRVFPIPELSKGASCAASDAAARFVPGR